MALAASRRRKLGFTTWGQALLASLLASGVNYRLCCHASLLHLFATDFLCPTQRFVASLPHEPVLGLGRWQGRAERRTDRKADCAKD
jgi:hypothetical protein